MTPPEIVEYTTPPLYSDEGARAEHRGLVTVGARVERGRARELDAHGPRSRCRASIRTPSWPLANGGSKLGTRARCARRRWTRKSTSRSTCATRRSNAADRERHGHPRRPGVTPPRAIGSSVCGHWHPSPLGAPSCSTSCCSRMAGRKSSGFSSRSTRTLDESAVRQFEQWRFSPAMKRRPADQGADERRSEIPHGQDWQLRNHRQEGLPQSPQVLSAPALAVAGGAIVSEAGLRCAAAGGARAEAATVKSAFSTTETPNTLGAHHHVQQLLRVRVRGGARAIAARREFQIGAVDGRRRRRMRQAREDQPGRHPEGRNARGPHLPPPLRRGVVDGHSVGRFPARQLHQAVRADVEGRSSSSSRRCSTRASSPVSSGRSWTGRTSKG